MSNKHPSTTQASNNGHLSSARAADNQAAESINKAAPEQVGAHLRSAGEHVASAARTAAGGLSEARSAASNAVQHGISDAKPELAAARREVRAAGDAAVDSAERQWAKAREQGGALLHRSEDFIRERPLAAVGIAVAGGFLLSRLLRR